TLAFIPDFAKAATMSSAMTSIAGQPLYVGIIFTATVPSSTTSASRTTPRSTIESTGISGSDTDLSVSRRFGLICVWGSFKILCFCLLNNETFASAGVLPFHIWIGALHILHIRQ